MGGGGGDDFLAKRGGKEDKEGVFWFKTSWLRKRDNTASASTEKGFEMDWFDGVGGGGAGELLY